MWIDLMTRKNAPPSVYSSSSRHPECRVSRRRFATIMRYQNVRCSPFSAKSDSLGIQTMHGWRRGEQCHAACIIFAKKRICGVKCQKGNRSEKSMYVASNLKMLVSTRYNARTVRTLPQTLGSFVIMKSPTRVLIRPSLAVARALCY
jgi:hypothetical protein